LQPLCAYYTLNTAAAKGSVPCSGTSSYKGHFAQKKKKKDASVVTQKIKNLQQALDMCEAPHRTAPVLSVDGSCSLNRAELENISTPSNSVTEHSELWTNRETSFKPCRSIYRNRKAKCLRKIDVRTVAY
jgi:hypothetical protein